MRVGRTIGAAAIAAIALTGAACSGDGPTAETSAATGTSTTPSGGENPPAETGAPTESTSTGEASEPALPDSADIGELLAVEPGSPLPIEAGTYGAADFAPPLTFTLSDVAIANGALPDELGLTVGPNLDVRVVFLGEGLELLRPKAKKQTSSDLNFDEEPATVDEIVSWLQKHPRLTSSKPKSVTIGDVEGSEVEVALKDGQGYRSDLCRGAEPCAPLFHTSPDVAASAWYAVNTGSNARIAVLDVDGQRVLVVTEAKASLDKRGKWADELLGTVTFGQ